MSIPTMMCPWAFGGCDRSRRWGRRWCGRGLFCVLCLLVLFIAPLASSESFLPSRWAVGQRLRARYPPVFFLVEKSRFGTGPAKKIYLPTWGVCRHPIKKNRLLPRCLVVDRPAISFFNFQYGANHKHATNTHVLHTGIWVVGFQVCPLLLRTSLLPEAAPHASHSSAKRPLPLRKAPSS